MFLKEFDYSIEMHKMKRKYNNKLMHYGLIGEERVVYELKKNDEKCLCLYNIRLFINGKKAQFDFIVILHDFIMILEVKNLLGNLIIREDCSFEREINNNGVVQRSGMSNPFVQIDYQETLLKDYLMSMNKYKEIKSYLIMANDKMLITNYSTRKEIIKYDEINKYIISEKVGELTKDDYEIGQMILNGDNEYNYYIVPIIKRNIINQYMPRFEKYSDLELFLEVIKLRKEYSIRYKIPICNVFNNIEAEALVIKKPKSKEEFISVKGFKEKRYIMFGEEIIKIFKNS